MQSGADTGPSDLERADHLEREHGWSGSPPSLPFVGRRSEITRLEALLAQVEGGRGIVCALAGEPGIGKTRLLEEAARMADARGVCVLVGRCREERDTPALWPWSEVLHSYLERAAHVDHRPYGAAIGELLPELRQRLGAVGKAWYLEPERARFRGFDGVARFVAAAARERPLAIVLEDLHAADPASLRLLEFVAKECSGARLLLLVSYRDLEVEPASPLATALAGLRRAAPYEELRLAPLGADEASELATMAGTSLGDGALRSIIERAEGNPLFILELVRSLADEAAAAGAAGGDGPPEGTLPLGVREMIDRRLDRLTAPCLATLSAAAVLGRAFGVNALEKVTGGERQALLLHLDEARARRLVGQAHGAIGTYRFAHALVHECLYARPGTTARSALHRRAAVALEELHAPAAGGSLAEIADHFYRGVLAGGVEQARAYAIRAGHADAARHAYEEAAKHYGRALSLWAMAPVPEEADRCGLLVDLGTAEQNVGEPERALARFREAVALARRLGAHGDARAPELLARAVFGVASMWGVHGSFDPGIAALLEEALGGLRGDSPLRAMLLGRTAAAYYWTDAAAIRDQLSAQAVAMARRVDDDRALTYALLARQVAIWSPHRVGEQLANAEDAVREGERRCDRELQLAGRFWRFRCRLELGDFEAACRDLRVYGEIADDLRHPHFRWNAAIARATLASLRGDFDEGERLAMEALELGRRAHAENAMQYFGIHMLMLARQRGDEALVVEAVREFVGRDPAIPAWRAALASLEIALGREREAALEVERLAAHDLEDLPRDANFLIACVLLGEAVVGLKDRTLARRLHDLLLPYASRNVVVAAGAGYFGVVSHSLGLLASTLGRGDSAERWFTDALTRYESMEAMPDVARVLIDRAGALLDAHGAGASKEVRGMVTRAGEIAGALGMRRAIAAVESLRARLRRRSALAERGRGGAAPEALTGSVFRREGDYWTLAHDGIVARLRDVKGCWYLAELLRAPDRDLDVLELVAASHATAERGTRGRGRTPRITGADAGPVLDRRAKEEYRRRIGELQDEIARAQEAGEVTGALFARQELEQIAGALAGAVGLGGRDRLAGAVAERARLNVTRAIHAVVDKIRATHPSLARHLAASIATGRFCRYAPDRDSRVTWQL